MVAQCGKAEGRLCPGETGEDGQGGRGAGAAEGAAEDGSATPLVVTEGHELAEGGDGLEARDGGLREAEAVATQDAKAAAKAEKAAAAKVAKKAASKEKKAAAAAPAAVPELGAAPPAAFFLFCEG